MHSTIKRTGLLLLLPIIAFSQIGSSDLNPSASIIPTRGFKPANSYLLADVESINAGTGALLFSIPLASLPSGPGGFTAGVSINYNSKLWETDPQSTLTNTVYTLKSSAQAGWRLSLGYTVELRFISSTRSACDGGGRPVQLKVIKPDGSEHVMALFGGPTYGADCDATVYPVESLAPGHTGSGEDPFASTTSQTWFSTDGSFLNLQIAPGNNWPHNDATLFLKDGSHVNFIALCPPLQPTCATNSGDTEIYDRNGNKIVWRKSATNTLSFETLTDSQNRVLTLEHTNSNQDNVKVAGADGTDLLWTIDYVPQSEVSPNEEYITSSRPPKFQVKLMGYPRKVSKITLPNLQTYQFEYAGRYSEISKITLPTGAYATYSYSLAPGSGAPFYYQILANTIKKKTLFHDGVMGGEVWDYSFEPLFSTITAPDQPDKSIVAAGLGITTNYFCQVDYRYSAGSDCSGRVYKTIYPDGSSLFKQWGDNNFPSPSSFNIPEVNPWVKKETHAIANSSGVPTLASTKVFKQDKNGNITRVEEYGWTTLSDSTNGPNVRTTISTYTTPTDDSALTVAPTGNHYATVNMLPAGTYRGPRNLAATMETQDSSNQVAVRTERDYDARGNLTAERRWDSTKAITLASGTSLGGSNSVRTAYGAYSTNGNPSFLLDSDNKKTTYTYGSFPGCTSCTDLYLTAETHGETSLLTTSYDYHFGIGLRTRVTDPNGITGITTYDKYGRPKQVQEGVVISGFGAGETITPKAESKLTKVYFDDVQRWAYSKSDLNTIGDGLLTTIRYFDQLGRPQTAWQPELASGTTTNPDIAPPSNPAGIRTDFQYLYGSGKNVEMVSNPYQVSESSAAPGRGWTVTYRDVSGRTCAVETVDGSATPTPGNCATAGGSYTGRATTTYGTGATSDGHLVIVTDPDTKKRETYSDSLGRLVKVIEDPSSLAYTTTYGYDALDNLKTVAQGSQTRSFVYTSLSRLKSATNPENGTTSYSYNDNGTLLTKSDARNVVTTMGYDDINRVISKGYSTNSLELVNYTYDGPDDSSTNCFFKGRLKLISSAISSTKYCYDSVGRSVNSTQTMPSSGGISYPFQYTYNLSGGLTSVTYPSNRFVSYTYDPSGRTVSAVNGNLTYASAIQYAPHGQRFRNRKSE